MGKVEEEIAPSADLNVVPRDVCSWEHKTSDVRRHFHRIRELSLSARRKISEYTRRVLSADQNIGECEGEYVGEDFVV